MEPIYISLGSQCTTPTFFDRLQLKKKSLPFDWMFSTPQFVFTILKLLLIDTMEIRDIIDTHFFVCDQRAYWTEKEPAHYLNATDGDVLINSIYNVAFPHNAVSDREKYIRRLERFKQYILDEHNFIYFVYISEPRPNYFVVNNVEPIQEIYEYMEKIHSIMKEIRTNYKILIFDTNRPVGVKPSDNSYISHYDLEQKNNWTDLLPELVVKYGHLLRNV